MRRAHDPSSLGRRGRRLSRHPQDKAGDARRLRCQCQPAAGDEIELPRFAPDFQHDDAKRIAGQRVSGRSQCGVHIRRTHCHQTARIETKFGPSAHRQCARFNFGEILTYPNQGPPCRHPPHKACDKTRRGGTLPACLGEHLMHCPQGKAALQHRIGIGMSEHHPFRGVCATIRFDAFDAAAQGRKRAHACGA